MRFIGTLGALTAMAALAMPAFSQSTTPAPTTPSNTAPSGNAPSNTGTTTPSTLTPPGSTTPIPLVPGGNGNTSPLPTIPNVPTTGGTAPTFPTITSMPGLPGTYPTPGMGTDDIFTGTSSTPTSLRLGDLTSDWKRMTITGSLDFGTLTQIVTELFASAGVGVYYTKGQTDTLGNTTYLVTYRTQPKAFDVTNLMQMFQTAAATNKPPAPERLTAQTPLYVTLLNLQNAGSLTDIRPFDLNREITDSANAAHAYDQLMNSLGSTIPTPTLPSPKPKTHSVRPRKSTIS